MIVSVVMAVASVQMVVESVESIVSDKIHPHVDWYTIGIMVGTVCVKLVLYMVCRT